MGKPMDDLGESVDSQLGQIFNDCDKYSSQGHTTIGFHVLGTAPQKSLMSVLLCGGVAHFVAKKAIGALMQGQMEQWEIWQMMIGKSSEFSLRRVEDMIV